MSFAISVFHRAVLLAALAATFLLSSAAFAQPGTLPGSPQNGLLAGPAPSNGAPTEPLHFPGEAIFNSSPSFLTGVTVDHRDFVYVEGQTLRVNFLSQRDAYLYLIYHQADGKSLLIFPNVAQRSNRAPAGQAVRIPVSEADLRIRIRPPLGREVLQVIATLDPIRELDRRVGAIDQFPAVAPAELARLAEALKKDRSRWTEARVPILTVAKEGEAPAVAPARVGLFVGIGKYQHPEFAETHEELTHSAEVMYDLMLKQGQLDPTRTRLVLNEQATKANLEELIVRWLPSVSKPGDTVFVYYSGHAGELDTSDRAAPNRQEQMLGPYDLDFGPPTLPLAERKQLARDTNLSGTTLARWFEELQGRQLVVILDTCRSAGLFRSKDLSSALLSDAAAGVKALAQMNMLVLASCAVDEQSLFEGTRNKTMWFTHCLTEALEQPDGPRPLTVQAAFEYSRRRMRSLLTEGNAGREQEPQITDKVLLPVILAP